MRPANLRASVGHVGRLLCGFQATLLFLALSAPPAVAQSIVVRVGDETTTTVAPGAEIQIPIVVDMAQAGGLDIASLTFDLTWDPSLLTYVEAVPGTFGSVVFNEADVASGQLATSVFNATGTTNTFTAISVVLSADAAAENQDALVAVDVTAAGNGVGTDISASVSEDNLCLCIGLAGFVGDVSDDGTVNIIDAQQIARYSVGLPPPPDPALVDARGDVNEDGLHNIIDAQQIARWTVGLPVPESPDIGQAMPGGCPGTCVTPPPPDGITGTWVGSIDVDGTAVPLTLWLTDTDGSVTGTGLLTYYQLNITGSRTGNDVTLTITPTDVAPTVFTGTWDGADALDGVVNGSGFTGELVNLTRGGDTYSGTTSQGHSIIFVVSEDGTAVEAGLWIRFSITCQLCTGTSTSSVFQSLPITDGSFSFSHPAISISGTAESATTFSGSAQFIPDWPPECGTCETANVTWTASLGIPALPTASAAIGVGDLAPVLIRSMEPVSHEGYCANMVIEPLKRE